jgi:hypothetical protein
MREFKIGDKVKIPKTKRGHPDVEKLSNCVKRAIEIKQDFLYFRGFYKSGGWVLSNVVILCENLDVNTGGDYFNLSEIELYNEIKKNETETETFIPLGIKNNGKDIFLVSEKDETSSLQYKSN